jgi:hypothetical protein
MQLAAAAAAVQQNTAAQQQPSPTVLAVAGVQPGATPPAADQQVCIIMNINRALASVESIAQAAIQTRHFVLRRSMDAGERTVTRSPLICPWICMKSQTKARDPLKHCNSEPNQNAISNQSNPHESGHQL